MYWKLTDQKMQTYDGFRWKYGKWYSIDKSKRGGDLCSGSWFHCYDDKLLAALLNPAHADISNPRLFRCHVRGKRLFTYGDKYGFTMMMIPSGSEIDMPEITSNQRAAFAILCAKMVYKEARWNTWADAWLDGTDRSVSAAWAASAASAARAAAWAAASAAASAAKAAKADATAAAWAAKADATAAAKDAARAAGWAATAAGGEFDLKAIAKQAMKY
jgi:hypothetical protein